MDESEAHHEVWHGLPISERSFRRGVRRLSIGKLYFQRHKCGHHSLLGSGAAVPMAYFLLGYPDTTGIAAVTNPDTDSWSKHYALFAQDDWKVSQSLTLNYGLRWEYNPPFGDRNENIANFDPAYTSVVNGQTVHGAVIVPNQFALTNVVYPGFTQSIFPTPIHYCGASGDSVNLAIWHQEGFRTPHRIRLAGFRDNKTVLRGGYGRFIETLTGGSASNGWAFRRVMPGFLPTPPR